MFKNEHVFSCQKLIWNAYICGAFDDPNHTVGVLQWCSVAIVFYKTLLKIYGR